MSNIKGTQSRIVMTVICKCLAEYFYETLWVLTPSWNSLISNIIHYKFDVCSLFCYVLLYVHSSFAIILMEKRELVALLFCLPGISWLLCDSSSQCHWFVCSLWLWYFLIILPFFNISQQHVKYNHTLSWSLDVSNNALFVILNNILFVNRRA